MKRVQRFTFIGLTLVLLLGLPILGQAEENASGDMDLMTITEFPEAIHFYNPAGDDIVVGPAAYNVSSAKDGNLQLESRSDKTLYILKAEPGTHKESLQQPIAVNVYGDVVDEPDISVLTLMLPDGTQFTAEGSYSGVRPRGLRDRLGAARQTLQGAAQEARRRIELRKQRFQLRAELAKQILSMPRPSLEQKEKLIRMAAKVREQNNGLIIEIGRRIAQNHPLLTALRRKGSDNWTAADAQALFRAIIGTGPNRLRLNTWPKEGPGSQAGEQPVSRGLIGGHGAAVSFGGSVNGAFFLGVNVGGYRTFYPDRWSPKYDYITGALSGGAQGGVSGNFDIGFWNAGPTQLASANWKDPTNCAWGVTAGVTAGVGVSVTVSVPVSSIAGLIDDSDTFRFSGLVISPNIGTEGKALAFLETCSLNVDHMGN